MTMKEKIIAKWGAIAKASKKTSKVVLCAAALLGSVAGSVAHNMINNSQQVSAIYQFNGSLPGTVISQGSDIKAVIFNYGVDDWGVWDAWDYGFNDDGSTPVGMYKISFEPDNLIVSSKFKIKLTYGNKTIYEGTYDSTNRVSYLLDVNNSNVNQKFKFTIVGCEGELPNPGANDSNEIYLRNFKWEINDSMAPVLEPQMFLTDVDNPISIEDILKEVYFVDGVDGAIEETIVSDNYTPNKNKVGEWEVQVKATDRAGNTGTGTIIVRVLDKTGPIITGPTTFTSNMSSPLTIETIISKLSANDNVDGDISNNIEIVSNGFTGNENVIGNKDVVVRVRDSAGNVSVDTTLKINCVDDVKPVISIKEGYSDSYTTSYENKMDINTILEGIVVTDNIDSNLSYEVIENKYEGNDTIPNTYAIKLRATDTAGNVSEIKTITITVTDEIPPVFYVSGKFIGVSQAQTLTHQELVNLLLYMEGINTEGAAVNLLSFGGYETGAVNAPGVYTLSYKTRTADGVESDVKTATIKVLGKVEEEAPKDEEEKGKWYITAWNFVKEHATYFYVGLGALFVGVLTSLGFSSKKDSSKKSRKRK